MNGQNSVISVMGGTIWGFVSKNWAFSVYAWGFILFATPVFVTDVIGYWRRCEFPDLFESMPWLVRASVIVALVYGIVFFARREANEFIYFAF